MPITPRSFRKLVGAKRGPRRSAPTGGGEIRALRKSPGDWIIAQRPDSAYAEPMSHRPVGADLVALSDSLAAETQS